MKIFTHRVPNAKCPYCGNVSDAVSNFHGNESAPKPGSYSICVECVKVSLFNEALQLRKPTTEEYIAMLANEQLMQVQRALRVEKAMEALRKAQRN